MYNLISVDPKNEIHFMKVQTTDYTSRYELSRALGMG